MTEARLDLHCHTSHSEDRERLDLPHGASIVLPFHPLLDPCAAYDLALSRGMTHVTFTDHDTLDGCLELVARHPRPERLLWGEEVTCYHRGQALHVGVYGLNEADHAAIHAAAGSDPERCCLRWNVPQLLDYCDSRGLAYDLKHPLWVHSGSTFQKPVLAELLPRFRLVEGLNGTRHRWLNDLGSLLARRLGPPGVACTGGSDSHTDNHGTCYTVTSGATPAEVLSSLRAGLARPVGAAGSHQQLEADTRKVLASNVRKRAGHLVLLADDQRRALPTLAQELLSLVVSGFVAYGVVNEFARQRALAREVEGLFRDELERGAADDAALGAPPAGGVVHGYLRRD
ncbi:MAG: PHP domain-containing protein [Fimbriimonadaceae bacterium]|nr:PHP domain-containing protein [Fimbriimonadaceae bacterium]